jgi:SAM-dependent methyltransferase
MSLEKPAGVGPLKTKPRHIPGFLPLRALLPPLLRIWLKHRVTEFVFFLRKITGYASIPLPAHHDTRAGAFRAYHIYNANYPLAEREFDAAMIGRAVEFGYMQWPRRIVDYVHGKDVLDIGCGTGIHSLAYVVVGVKSYVGVDPRVNLASGRAKNVTNRQWEEFGWTPADIMARFSRIKLVQGTAEELPKGETFDIAIMHNVTEHLLQLENVLHMTAERLRPGGSLLFNHHNYYCWNGHHMAPKTVSEIDPHDAEQKNYIDWAHIRFEPPADHYIRRGLNRIKLDELKERTARYFDIEIWEERPSQAEAGGSRLTAEIAARFPDLTKRDLKIHNVFCVARRKSAPA